MRRSQKTMGNQKRWNVAASACLMLLGLGLAGCENEGDPLAPADSTITVSANPQTVILPSGGGSGTSQITATLRSKNGTRLPDQEVTFSTTGGTLDPPAETPLLTDTSGQVVSTLTTTSAATITARSGSITGTTQIQTSPGDLSQFVLAVVPQELLTCTSVLMVTATVLTTTGNPVQGILVIFDEEAGSTLTGTFLPASQVTSNSMGKAEVTWTPSATVCAQQCAAATSDPNTNPSGICTLSIQAEDTTGAFGAVPVEIDDNIP